ncbi:conserved hypothetical protein [Candidatus Nitrospira nitrificans]|uniref:Transcription elongation factor n=2 Tax=Candidatus Nitrospira nitrificans TaxID=1742973 RepID=A0A0S4LUM3_9BACT|nr:conserved hypothetical protein [Candidatus Nitrospira nitrificans]
MPTARPRRRAEKAKREGKAPTTQAGEFVKEEMHDLKRGKRNVTSRKQAIAIGLSKARRAEVKLPGRARKANRKGSRDDQ